MKTIGFDFICIDPLGNKFVVHRGFDEIVNGVRPLSHNGVIQKIESVSITSEHEKVFDTIDGIQCPYCHMEYINDICTDDDIGVLVCSTCKKQFYAQRKKITIYTSQEIRQRNLRV